MRYWTIAMALALLFALAGSANAAPVHSTPLLMAQAQGAPGGGAPGTNVMPGGAPQTRNGANGTAAGTSGRDGTAPGYNGTATSGTNATTDSSASRGSGWVIPVLMLLVVVGLIAWAFSSTRGGDEIVTSHR